MKNFTKTDREQRRIKKN